MLTEKDSPNDLVHMKTWENLLQINIELKEWKNIHLTCFQTILDNQIIWLQYRILQVHNILGTKALLYKMKKAENNLCRFCNNMPETITRVFVDCLYSTKIWDLLKNCIYQEISSTFDIDKKSILLVLQCHSAITFSINAITFQGSRLRCPSMLNMRYFRFGRKFRLSVRPSGCDFYVDNISALEANFEWQEAWICMQYVYH